MEESRGEGGAGAAVVEDAKGHDRVFGELPFVEKEEDKGKDAEDEQTEGVG